MIKKYNQFLLESSQVFKYYAFDIDDNLLFMTTKLHMDKKVDGKWVPVDVSTEEFAIARKDTENYRYRDGNLRETFVEFRDYGPRGDKAFLEDWIDAIKNNRFGPSWNQFIKCLINGSLFALITSRGHEPETIKKTVLWTIDNYLSKDQYDIMLSNLSKFNRIFKDSPKNLVSHYLDQCMFCGVYSETYQKIFGDIPTKDAKVKAIQLFAEKIHNLAKQVGGRAVLGFSDDDIEYLNSIKNCMKNELSLKYVDMGLNVVFTGNREYKRDVIRD